MRGYLSINVTYLFICQNSVPQATKYTIKFLKTIDSTIKISDNRIHFLFMYGLCLWIPLYEKWENGSHYFAKLHCANLQICSIFFSNKHFYLNESVNILCTWKIWDNNIQRKANKIDSRKLQFISSVKPLIKKIFAFIIVDWGKPSFLYWHKKLPIKILQHQRNALFCPRIRDKPVNLIKQYNLRWNQNYGLML